MFSRSLTMCMTLHVKPGFQFAFAGALASLTPEQVFFERAVRSWSMRAARDALALTSKPHYTFT